MAYDVARINSLITSPEIFLKSKLILVEYQDAIEKMMMDTVEQDVRELDNRVDRSQITDIEEFASEETARRMGKYGKIFFDDEMERLLDGFNDERFDLLEFKLRCEILTGLADSLANYDSDKLKSRL